MADIKGQKLMLLKDPVSILITGLDKKIGNPQQLHSLDAASMELDREVEIPSIQNVEEPIEDVIQTKEVAPSPAKKVYEPKIVVPSTPIKDQASNNYMPIKALNTFTRDWVVKARVSSKGELRTTKNGGKLLKLELVDNYGTAIEATMFNDSAKHFDPMVEENKVYLFSNGYVKLANKKFTSVKNDFSITFEERSLIQEVVDDGTITQMAFEFTKIADL